MMREESTTPDLVQRVRLLIEAMNRRDFDAFESFFTPDAVWRGMEIGTFEGAAAVRGFVEDMVSPYEEWEMESEEILDLGNGVIFAVIVQSGRPVGSTGHVEFRYGSVATWVDGSMARITNYTDIDEARAAAERLAQERG
jgi:ketosteroid isomerase-like protein